MHASFLYAFKFDAHAHAKRRSRYTPRYRDRALDASFFFFFFLQRTPAESESYAAVTRRDRALDTPKCALGGAAAGVCVCVSV